MKSLWGIVVLLLPSIPGCPRTVTAGRPAVTQSTWRVPVFDLSGNEITSAALDFDNNGKNDVVSVRYIRSLRGHSGVSISIGEPTSVTTVDSGMAFKPVVGTGIGGLASKPLKAQVGDFNKDDRLDVRVVFKDGSQRTLYNRPASVRGMGAPTISLVP